MASLFAVGLPWTYDGTTNHFATTSGGVASVAAVTSADTVTVDSLSGNATLTVGAAWSCTALTINNTSATVACDATHGITASGAVTLTAGTLNTNAQTCSWGSFVFSNTTTATLTITNSNITLTGLGIPINMSGAGNATNLTLNASGSTITLSGANVTIQPGGKTWGSLVFSGSGTATINAIASTFANLTRTGTANKTDAFVFFAGHTITGNLTITGNSDINRVFFNTGNPGAQVTVTVNGSVSLANVDFMDIKSAGTAGTWTGTLLGDAQGNAGITFDTPVSQTWSGNTAGTWSASANWTSRVPLSQDNIVINGLTSGTITLDMPRLGADIDCTGSTGGKLSPGTNVANFGNLTLASGMTMGSNGWAFSGRGNQTVTCNGVVFAPTPSWNCPNGTYTHTDDFISNVAPVGNVALFSNGTLTVQGAFTVPRFSFNATHRVATVLNMGNGLWTLYGTGIVWSPFVTNFTLNAQSSTIIVSDTSVTTKTFAGSGLTYNNLQVNGAASNAAVILTGANTFNDITGQANAHLTLPSSTTTAISSLTSQGTSGNLFVLDASTAGTAATLSSANIINTDFLSVKDNTASGNTPFYAGGSGTLVSGTTSWLAQSAPVNLSQAAATITFSGGTQSIATVNNVSIAQLAATITFSGGVQAIAAVNNAAVTQSVASVTFSGGTQVIATINNVSLSQVAATVTLTGGTQVIATVRNSTITQLAGTVTLTGGTQSIAAIRAATIAQLAATMTFAGGTQTLFALAATGVIVSQQAARLTFAGGVQAIAKTNIIAWVSPSITINSGAKAESLVSGSNSVKIASGSKNTTVTSGGKET